MTPSTQLGKWLECKEDEHLEFKEAKNAFEFEELVKYCAALANERGGVMILGVTNKRPRHVVGTRAFDNLERTRAGLTDRLRLRIETEEVNHPDGRVLVFHVPSRPIGMPIPYKGAYWMRSGESLVPMTPDRLKRIFAESEPDYTAEVCPAASLNDLDPDAIKRFRTKWREKSGNPNIDLLTDEQLLADAGLLVAGKATYAALILLGTGRALTRHLAQAEVIFEYRSSDASGPANQRVEHRRGFFLFEDDIWNTINLRNDLQHYQDGFYIWDIPTFREMVVREAVLNAVSHRDYRDGGSVFIRQYPRRLEIVSPGGFPEGITLENILWKQSPRNRLIADTFAKCGLVERAGQGANRMFEQCIRESKPRPDFSHTDDHEVFLTLHGEVQNPAFLKFLEKVGKETQVSFSTQELLLLDNIHRDLPIPRELRQFLPNLREQGIIEIVGRTKGAQYVLSRRFYSAIGEPGTYTRKRGLDRETNKALLDKHIRSTQQEGCRLSDLAQVLPHCSLDQIRTLLREMRDEGRVHCRGRRNAARWFPLAYCVVKIPNKHPKNT